MGAQLSMSSLQTGGVVQSLAVVNGAALLSQVVHQTLTSSRTIVPPALLDRSMLSFTLSLLLSQALGLGGSPTVADLLETAAWRVMLPASVAMSVISNCSPQGSEPAARSAAGLTNALIDYERYWSMLGVFLLGALSSVLGGINACFILTRLATPAAIEDKFIIATSLTASYIGGTVNFFETANSLPGSLYVRQQTRLIAAADIGVMVAYFAVLQAIHSLNNKRRSQEPAAAVQTVHSAPFTKVKQPSDSVEPSSIFYQAVVASVAVLLALGGSAVQGLLTASMPGLSVLLITVVSAVVSFLLRTKAPDQVKANVHQAGQGQRHLLV